MNRVTVYDPFAEVFPHLFRGFVAPVKPSDSALEVRIDVKENDTEYVVHAEIPGVTKEDIRVDIDGKRVSIAAEVKRESEEKDGARVLRSERYFGAVGRSFALANEVDETRASARYENGVLVLTLPKKAVAGVRRVTIQ